ncbi:GNAT family N-acetyltransferase [Cellulomonas sp. B6]|jgi:GNAT superfamily N-acetyltransferase|uniref:GNAT family N-acetyltransferase n=1 Tax=Cellulomonas sp. B6 TaxID=1295626 RepID=UPI00073AFF16|nr:GNAT family N-acetyltransferase [Cellulomonas sp. B6]KSW17668.1 acetyltransferase [Cellulomonas sp. B6]
MTTDGTPPRGTTGLDTGRYRFTTDRADVDRAAVHRWLSERSYWARGRSRAAQDAAIDGSLCFGVVERVSGQQVAFARVVTDGATFAWLCDVFVDEEHRGSGVGVALVAGTVAHLEALGLPRVVLATADAHGLYERFGFAPVEPGRYLALLRDPAAPTAVGPGSADPDV